MAYPIEIMLYYVTLTSEKKGKNILIFLVKMNRSKQYIRTRNNNFASIASLLIRNPYRLHFSGTFHLFTTVFGFLKISSKWIGQNSMKKTENNFTSILRTSWMKIHPVSFIYSFTDSGFARDIYFGKVHGSLFNSPFEFSKRLRKTSAAFF